jgi:hypothetical protein
MITITGFTGDFGPIPSTISGLPVTCIGDSTFRYRFPLANVTIHNSVDRISV